MLYFGLFLLNHSAKESIIATPLALSFAPGKSASEPMRPKWS